ncbi:hypothetical protein BCR35DRAFT_282056 [Leucosporidium creatinivorum]|uniref:C2H2-type domain-containing protein n=1 Tax=Leucosporidium creatinivorum TaxID=106004 RepID=A0A1Y2EP15_9BASI|nr:hypothetical protein BCR35DRAFT_282056 [Leucosporidium creatinivorum]
MAYYLSNDYESTYYPASTEDPSLATSFGIDSSIYPPSGNATNITQPLSSTAYESPRSVPSAPIYDPDSPFNSSIIPVRSVGRDGRLKNKLMGVGTEGGYLTSPLILGGKRMGNSGTSSVGGGATPEISIDSPASVAMTPGDSFASIHDGSTSSSMRASSSLGAGSGIGMGISGMTGELGFQGEGTPRARSRTTGAEYTSYESMPSTMGRSQSNGATTTNGGGAPAGMGSPTKFVEHRFPKSPPLAAQPPPPATGRRPKKNLTVKVLNKARSCSALSPSSAQAQYPNEPLTPVSAHSTNFMIPGVPYNSPIDADLAAQQAEPGIMPFSFADLYNFGLAVDSVEEIDPRKSPFQFANDLLNAEGNQGNSGGLGIGIGLGMGPNGGYQEEHDYNLLHSLPTPYLAHGSGFSSPATSYLSDVSPDMGVYNHHSPGQLSSASMLSAPSMESVLSLPPPANAGRQPCSPYNAPAGIAQGGPTETAMDPALLSPQGPPMQHRQLSSTSAYGPSAKYAYPTRYVQQQPGQQPQQAPPMTWANSVPPGSQAQHQHQQFVAQSNDYVGQVNHTIDTSLFIPPYQSRANADAYERNLEAFDDMYERYSGSTSVFATPGKRGRAVDDEEDEDYDDASGDYVPGGRRSGGGAGGKAAAASGTSTPGATTHKRLRTVASAPCLPTRRMRPGPKPKVNKSPGQQHESVFSARHLSPPPLPTLRRGSSPYHSDGSPVLGGAGSDDEDGEGGTRGSLPKEVIQSLYEGVPSHVENGVKVPKRYICLMEGCDRTFPRKSAIESHIQTHLEDKPFVCPQPDCDASFVRQHDLRRHERIHSGNKPFPCPCGKGFARGDALARHRARGICSGSLVPRRM